MPADDADHTTDTFLVDDRSGDTASPIQPACRLVCLGGEQAGQVFRIGAAGAVIGRGPDVDILLVGEGVSRRHARIGWHSDHFVLEDLGSRNGTSINGLPARQRRLEVGDYVQIGGSAILVVARDDDLEQRAVRLQKLEALATLAGGMVHDFRNTLAVIFTNAELLSHQISERFGAQSDLLPALKDILAATSAGTELTQRLLYFARREAPPEKSLVVLAALVEDVVALIRRSFEVTSKIRISIDADSAVSIRAHRDELHHALLNLCLNARDAMPAGGELAVRVRALEVGRPEALQLFLPSAGRFVELAITDTGLGMDAATQARIFEPFFTTKKPGEGTGLGLSTVYGIIRAHGGNVLVDSVPGRTCFRVLLPAPAEVAHEAPVLAPAPDASPGEARSAPSILVVEDDEAIAEAIAEPLRRAGYVVDTARDGATALSAMRDHVPDLVLLDLMMPGMDGWQVMQAMQRDPVLSSIPVCIVSAFTDKAPSFAKHVLEKPIQLIPLLAMVERLCGLPGGRGGAARRR